MVPRLIALADLPLIPNGKIAVARLPRPAARTSIRQDESQVPQALGIACCMAEVLGLPHVGTNDDFYDLGGDSLLALRLISLVRSHHGLSLYSTDVMQEPTPEGLARLALSDKDRPRCRAGREVTLLAVLDAAGPGGRPTVTGAARLRAHLCQLRRRGLGHLGTIRAAPDRETPSSRR